MIHEIMLLKGRRNPKKRYRDEIKEKNYFCVFMKNLQIYIHNLKLNNYSFLFAVFISKIVK